MWLSEDEGGSDTGWSRGSVSPPGIKSRFLPGLMRLPQPGPLPPLRPPSFHCQYSCPSTFFPNQALHVLVQLQVRCLERVTPGRVDRGVGADPGLPLPLPPQRLPRPGHQFLHCKHLVQFGFSYLDLTGVPSSCLFL